MNYNVKNIYGKTNNKRVTVNVPGSKSITARAMLIAALANGESTLYGAQFSDDCKTFLNCLKELGINCEKQGTTVKICGCGGRLEKKQAEIDVGSAGTAARFLPALLAFQGGEYKLTCSDQMKNRPIASLISALKALGAQFTFLEKENSYPFIIRGTSAVNAQISVDVTESSQFLSALLISAVCANKPVKIKVIGSHGLDYVNITLNMMWSFGVTVDEGDGEYTVAGRYLPKKYDVEPDISAACYFYAMNKILGTQISVCRGYAPQHAGGY